MIEEYYKKLCHLFKRYGNPKRWGNHFKVRFGIEAWNTYDLSNLYTAYENKGNLKEHIAVLAPIPRVELSYKGNIDNLISQINSFPNLNSTQVIYITNEINNVDHLNKLKDSFPDKSIVVKWDVDDIFIDDAISVTYMIDYYKQVITEADLSPLEQITMAYDIIKSFYYQDSINSQVSQVVNTGAFRCRGFVQFFNRLLKELGIKTRRFGVDTKEGALSDAHARGIALVYDEKYQKNGVFVFDPTFDSISQVRYYKYKEDVVMSSSRKKIGYTKGDSLCNYKHFLVPLISYEKTFPFSSGEWISNMKNSEEELKKVLHTNQSDHEIKALSAEDFIKLIYRVRLAEGYSVDDMPKIIQEALFASGYEYYRLDNIKNYLDSISDDIKQIAA